MDQGSSSSSSTNKEPQAIHKIAKKPGKGVRLTSQEKEGHLRERGSYHRTYSRGYRSISDKCV